MSNEYRIINCAEIGTEDWTFLQGKIHEPPTTWSFHSATPQNLVERLVRRPRLSRYRACYMAARDSKNADLVVTHLPRITWWVSVFMRMFGSRTRHLAFSFNFTKLPCGISKAFMSRAFRTVDRFIVFSKAEKTRYAEYFGIDPDRIDMVHWAMKRPVTSDSRDREHAAPFICAVGGEGRDYATLMSAMKFLPEIKLVLVARPSNVKGISIPPNVEVYTNLPLRDFWLVVNNSRFVVIPLLDSATNCGHITMVGSMLLQKAIISTISSGTSDYVVDGQNAILVPPGDPAALAGSIAELWNMPDRVLELGRAGHNMAQSMCDERSWVEYFSNYLSYEPPHNRTADKMRSD